jgi:hypothetical protein
VKSVANLGVLEVVVGLKLFVMNTQMDDHAKLYFEAHVTIEPVFDECRAKANGLALLYGFKLAHLLMQKRSKDTPERSQHDTFMTGHSKGFTDIKSRLIQLVTALQNEGFKVWRYKIEDTIVDSRTQDEYNLLREQNAKT